MRLLLAALILLAALPIAEAQLPVQPVGTSVFVTIVDSGKPAGLERPTLAPIQITYQFSQGGVSNEPTSIDLSVEEIPSWATAVSVEPALVLAPINPGFNQRVQLNATLNFTAPANAPAYEVGNFTVLARARPNANMAASEGRGILTTKPDFLGNLSVSAEQAVVSGGSWSAVPFRIVNHGNGATQVRVSVLSKPEPSEVELPPAATLAPGAEGLFEVRLRLPWTSGVDGTLRISAEGTSAVNPRAEKVTVEGETRVDGRSPVPLPPWVPLAALGAALVFLGKRRSQR